MTPTSTPTVGLLLALIAVLAAAHPARADQPPASSGAAVTTAASPSPRATTLAPDRVAELENVPFVYIASTRKNGQLGQAAEIWFQYSDGSVWVASSPKSWRVKRIRWGRPQAKIWIGRRDGPSFRARGELVQDPKRYDALCAAFAVKYPDRWPRWEASFRDGLRSGERVLIRYTPVAD